MKPGSRRMNVKERQECQSKQEVPRAQKGTESKAVTPLSAFFGKDFWELRPAWPQE